MVYAGGPPLRRRKEGGGRRRRPSRGARRARVPAGAAGLFGARGAAERPRRAPPPRRAAAPHRQEAYRKSVRAHCASSSFAAEAEFAARGARPRGRPMRASRAPRTRSPAASAGQPPPPLARELYKGGASRRARGARDGRPLRRRGPPREARCLRQGRTSGAGTRSRSRDRAASGHGSAGLHEKRGARTCGVRTDLWTGQNRCAWGWSAAAQMLPAPRYSHPICSFWQHHTFLSADHPARQLEYPAWQSKGFDVVSAQPTPLLGQHHAFLSSDQPASQFE